MLLDIIVPINHDSSACTRTNLQLSWFDRRRFRPPTRRYGTDEATGTDYWLVKNSFGRHWGEAGFFKMARGVNMCGIEQAAYSPIVA
jgi:hypothetical protein